MPEGILTLGTPAVSLGVGDSNDLIVGTKTSGPRGIESSLEFNGLYLNVREWVDTYIISTINGIDDADVRDARDVNPGQHGETPGDAFYGGRTLVLQGKVVARTIWKLRDLQQALRKAFSDLTTEYALYFRSNDVNTDMLIFCKKSGQIQMADEQSTANSFERPFQITLRASNPRFLSYLEMYTSTAWPGGGALTTAIKLSNNGNFAAQPKFRIYGPLNSTAAGGIALSIVNDANNKALVLKSPPGSTACIAAGRYIEIDIAKRSMQEFVTAGDVFVANAFNKLDITSDWLELESGTNNLTATTNVASSTPTIDVRHRHTYM